MCKIFAALLSLVLLFLLDAPVKANNVPFGVHLLEPGELEYVLPYRGENDRFVVTIPMAMDDRRKEVWEDFFQTSFKAEITPIVRWITGFEGGNWKEPTRKDVIDATAFLADLNWPGQRTIILWNEPNHAKEWGGRVDPESYADIAYFALNWLKTEGHEYTVLPAGLDGAAPNGMETMDSIRYMELVWRAKPELYSLIDGWTSHSYPNPDFSSTPYTRGKNSLRGFEVELIKLKAMTGKELPVYITETGWRDTRSTNRVLVKYYSYAAENIWNNPNIKAVTVFLLRGFNGPFEDFSLLDERHEPTTQMRALMAAMKLSEKRLN